MNLTQLYVPKALQQTTSDANGPLEYAVLFISLELC